MGSPTAEARQRAGRTAIVFKLASAGTAHATQLELLRHAFPDVPFAYLVRDPVASVASLTAPQASSSEVLASPCLRWRGRPASLQRTLLERANATDPLELTLEQYCAAHLGAMHEAMLTQIGHDGKQGRKLARRRSLVLDHAALPHVVIDELAPHFQLPLDDRARALALAYGALNAKNANERGYKSKVASEPARRWATAYAGATYARLRVLSSSKLPLRDAVRAAASAAAAAAANVSAGEGRFGHTAGLQRGALRRKCRTRP